jgi:hypothetical protein
VTRRAHSASRKSQRLEQPIFADIGLEADADFEVMARALAKISSKERKRFVSQCERLLVRPSVVRSTASRVAICKALCGSVPESESLIRRILKPGRGRDVHELQFSLFCFLDRIRDRPEGRSFSKEIVGLTESYLDNVSSNTARAAWMAAHLLADHWKPKSEGIRALTKVVQTGRTAAGRRAALSALIRVEPQSSARESSAIDEALEQAAHSDRSRAIRISATLILRRRRRHPAGRSGRDRRQR